MTANTRLHLIAGIILVSAVYAILIAKDPALASAIASGYIALLLTVLVVLNLWKKP